MAALIQVGIDIGQRTDPTAYVVADLQQQEGIWHYVVRYMKREPLGTAYPAIVEAIMARDDALRERGEVRYWLDATGVGQPVIDMLCGAGLAGLVAVYITGSDRAVQEAGELRLGKALLVSRLQVLLQAGRIHLPRTPETPAMVDELVNYEIRVSENAHDSYGAFKTGKHDDLVTALGLACWEEPRRLLLWA